MFRNLFGPYPKSKPSRPVRGYDNVERYGTPPSILPEDVAGAGRAIVGSFKIVERPYAYNSTYYTIDDVAAGLAYGQLDRPMLVDPTYLLTR